MSRNQLGEEWVEGTAARGKNYEREFQGERMHDILAYGKEAWHNWKIEWQQIKAKEAAQEIGKFL